LFVGFSRRASPEVTSLQEPTLTFRSGWLAVLANGSS
jgi:hypothetical protein